jgi:hypothetical protein
VDIALVVGIWRALALHRNVEAASWELIPVACMCGDIQEVYDRSYSPHWPGG